MLKIGRLSEAQDIKSPGVSKCKFSEHYLTRKDDHDDTGLLSLGKCSSHASVEVIKNRTNGMYFAAKYVSLDDFEPDKKAAAIKENNILKFLRHKNITRLIDTFIE